MYMVRYFIFACLFSAVSAQATAHEKHASADGYQSTVEYAEFWLPLPENEGDQPDALVASETFPAIAVHDDLDAIFDRVVITPYYFDFQPRAPPNFQ